jgi:phosphatidylserine decarboxylase
VIEICTPDVRVLLVPVAAILVASLVLHGVPHPLDLTYRGPNELPLSRQVARGEELGYFRNGSTILVFAAGESVALASGAACGRVIRMGTPLFRRTQSSALPLTPSRST